MFKKTVWSIALLAGSYFSFAQPGAHENRLKISGVYPHLAVFNEGFGLPCTGNGNEGGIGAITPWAGKLWMVTYSPHCPYGSADKLYSIDSNLNLVIHPESVGGTPANRLIHKESKQLITGHHFINEYGRVRTISPSVMPGRMTATTRHLTDPANWVYFYDMEGMLYETNVNTLEVRKLFHKPVPGWHGKGAYVAQKQLLVANNGEHAVFDIKSTDLKAGGPPRSSEDMGVLASWDGNKWSIVERKQFTDITGPGGIYGNSSENDPAWSIGWDKRSVILKLLDKGEWLTYRLPKATHTYDHIGGWYTEWPRIREVGEGKMLMDMHGMFYSFPKSFAKTTAGGIHPLGSHLRYIPDFCEWNGALVLATDETTILENPLAGRSQSNLWFGSWEELSTWGPASGWGAVWMKDLVEAGKASDPFLLNGFQHRTMHITNDGSKTVEFTIEGDMSGNNQWQVWKKVSVKAKGYTWINLPTDWKVQWVRVKANQHTTASAVFQLSGKLQPTESDPMFQSVMRIDDLAATASTYQSAIIRPAGHNKNLQVLFSQAGNKYRYEEVNEELKFSKPRYDSTDRILAIGKTSQDFQMDEASVLVTDKTGTWRLPKTNTRYEQPFPGGWPRGKRELESERFMLNAHGTFYEVGRESGYAAIRPVSTHEKAIMDFCTWRGLLVLSGTSTNAQSDGHYFPGMKTDSGLWFGAIDDLWKLGKPRGEGGAWKKTAVKAQEYSIPYLMRGYDKKKLSLTADKDVIITIEVDVDQGNWQTYQQVKLVAGKTVELTFPDSYQANWIRFKSNRDCIATAWLSYY
ncbi:hypothetical protein GCM10027036_28420 [Flavihumibacter cheonanensis]|uniref:hypothetical protein n=1 Tax=Flavihumibacter cheonanensis TaxID=1442385 RepID=UPI001EF812B2|nr:hypothetical protein [Flavihumibacter cheonanensis]MCG7753135.1 hypothetical protein [Flavihumibacter cheonanensis]